MTDYGLYTSIFALAILSILTYPIFNAFAIGLNSTSIFTNNFTKNLDSKIDNLITSAINDTNKILNSTSLLSNESNLSSSNIIISNNRVISTVNNDGSDTSSSSLVKNQIKTINGVCTSTKVGGNGNDTLTSSGKCNDEMTGGSGADKFSCGEGNDTIKDFNPKEGDVILDKQNCETVL